MGLNMRERLRERGLEAIGYDLDTAARDVGSLEALIESLPAPRAIWVMVPAGAPTRQVIGQLSVLLDSGDLVVDGGNSRFTDDTLNATRKRCRSGVRLPGKRQRSIADERHHRRLMMAILHDRVHIAKAVNARAISLDEAPQGYAEFDSGEATKFVIDPHNLIGAI
jgi:6-phosphogluconate dehydrogenase (decarboxylating)